MMTRQYSREAKRNLRKGAEKMEAKISPAARVRREFRLGRPPKSTEHLRPLIAVDKAESSLADLRNRMRQAKIEWFKDEYVQAKLVTVDDANVYITSVEHRDKMIAELSGPGAYALGCVFFQFDADAGERGQFAYFYVPFIGLTDEERATIQEAAVKLAAEVKAAEGRAHYSA